MTLLPYLLHEGGAIACTITGALEASYFSFCDASITLYPPHNSANKNPYMIKILFMYGQSLNPIR